MNEPAVDPGPTSFLDSLGERGRQRAEPRTSIALAGAGCALGVLGVLVVAGDTGVSNNDDFNRLPGLLLSALVVALGFFVLSQARRGALATAGAVAAALGVPAVMFFLTFDANNLPPYSTEGILIVSTGIWLATYAASPGRGRPFFLGAGLLGVWATILQITEKLFDAPFNAAESFFGTTGGGTFDPDTGEFIESSGYLGSGSGFHAPDPATIGLLSLGLGLAFLLVGRWLDQQGRPGVGTPFALAALPALAVGIIGLAPDLEAAGTGVFMVAIGLALTYHGATVWRRATNWIGGATVAAGLALFLGDMAGDDVTIGGMLFIAGGIAMVFAGHAVATATREPDELTPTRPAVGVAAGPMRRVEPLLAEPAPAPPSVDDSQFAPPIPPPPGAPLIPPPPGAPPPQPPDPPQA